MASANQLTLPAAQFSELEKLARERQKTVPDVVIEAIDRYIRDEQWESLKRYGIAKSRELGLTEADVRRLIAESRRERGQ
jgi:hypothetical protein